MRVSWINLVMPEDYYVPMHDFDLHMKIIKALHKFYPATHVSLHADELAMGWFLLRGCGFIFANRLNAPARNALGMAWP